VAGKQQASSRSLFDPQSYEAKRWLDFATIPARVWPTGISILEQNGDYLIYRVADEARKISKKQDQIFRSLARLSNGPDSRCNVTVLVVTGIPEVTARSWALYDHVTCDDPEVRLRPTTTEEIQQFIHLWFGSRGRR
jgi:hypothetical protein